VLVARVVGGCAHLLGKLLGRDRAVGFDRRAFAVGPSHAPPLGKRGRANLYFGDVVEFFCNAGCARVRSEVSSGL